MFSFINKAKYCLPVLFVAIILSSSSEIAAAVNLKARAVSLGANDDDLTSLVDCVEQYYFAPNTALGDRTNKYPIPPYMYEHTTPPNDAHVSSTIEYDIYNMYSLKKKRNYYYIKIKCNINFSPAFKGIYSVKDSHKDWWYRVYGVYCSQVEMRVLDPTNRMTIHEHIPNTTTSSTTEQTSFSFSLGGVAGYKGGPDVEVRPSIGATSTITRVFPDVTITDDTSGDRGLRWTFKLKEPVPHYAPFTHGIAETEYDDGAAVGKSTFTPEMNILISFPDNGKAPKLSLVYGITLRSIGATSGKIDKDMDISKTHYFTNFYHDFNGPIINLPFITYGKARKAAKKAGLI